MVLFQSDPFREFDAPFERFAPARRSSAPAPISMDAYRRDDSVWVHLDLPGVSTESIDIHLERNVLTVSAQREWARQADDQLYVAERRSGSFSRQVHLGDGLDADNIEADFSDGVLTLRIPVAERAKPRKIEVGARSKVLEAASP